MGNTLWSQIHGLKIEAITNIAPPTSQKEVQNFIGVINYYRYIWPRRSHTFAPLTKLTSIKRKFKWKKVEQDAFEEIKRIVARGTLLTYPDFNKKIEIRINASVFQLVVVISQKGKPIAFYSRKHTDDQQQ